MNIVYRHKTDNRKKKRKKKKQLSLILSGKSLVKIYKSFVRFNLDYADIIYDKDFNESFKRKTEIIQYKAAPVITDAIKGKSSIRLY